MTEAALPPKKTFEPELKPAPLIVTVVVPPLPEVGVTELTTGGSVVRTSVGEWNVMLERPGSPGGAAGYQRCRFGEGVNLKTPGGSH